MKKLLCVVSLLLTVSCGVLYAQSAAGSSKDVTPSGNVASSVQKENVEGGQESEIPMGRGIPMPQNIRNLMEQGNDIQAIEEFSVFKDKQKKSDKFHMTYLEMTLYRDLAVFCPSKSAQYTAQMEKIISLMMKKYPKVSDVYLLQIKPESSFEEILELATKAIDADPENSTAYEMRARALFQLGKKSEGCADFEKLPYKEYLPEYRQCADL